MPLPAPSPSSTCLVTGASSGIGAEIARELARRGYGVTLVARREAALHDLAGELSKAYGVHTEVIAADLTDEGQRTALPKTLAERNLRVDVLVNNAGFGSSGLFADLSRDDELALVRTNVEAVVDLCALFLPAMVERGEGAVLNVASTAAFQPLPGMATYAASKAFVLSFSEALAAETSITVTALCPGPVRTRFAERAGLGHVEHRSPNFLWTSAEHVARVAVSGLAADRRVVVPGPLNQVSALAGRFSPRSVLLPLVRRFNPGLS